LPFILVGARIERAACGGSRSKKRIPGFAENDGGGAGLSENDGEGAGLSENDGEGEGFRPGISRSFNENSLIPRTLAQTMKGGVLCTPPFIIVL